MLVFISDLHLTDGTSGETIKAGAFKLFRDQLKQLVLSIKKEDGELAVEKLKIVLLGDIFDVIRSARWLDPGVEVRPWSPANDPALKPVVEDIVNDILKENKKSLSYLKDLRQFAKKNKISFELQYIIGNHDWLINRYPSIVKTVASKLGIATPSTGKFLTELLPDADYEVIAKHGDCYDKYNFMDDRNNSSIGDAIVIELLNKFPEEVRKKLSSCGMQPDEINEIVAKLREIDNVRPMSDVPSWILMVSSGKDPTVRQAIESAWQKCVDDFFEDPFTKSMNISTKTKLWLLFQPSSHIPKWVVEKLAGTAGRIQAWLEVDYAEKAWEEPTISSGKAKYVVYGHTHDHLIVPLDQTASNGSTSNKIYFNTGTWRQTWNKVVSDKVHREFIGWKVLTYVAIYKTGENKNYDFEVWNGALG